MECPVHACSICKNTRVDFLDTPTGLVCIDCLYDKYVALGRSITKALKCHNVEHFMERPIKKGPR